MHEPTEPIPPAWACQVDARDLHDLLIELVGAHGEEVRNDPTWQRLDAACSGVGARDDLRTVTEQVLDLIGQAQREPDPRRMVELMREATSTMDGYRARTPGPAEDRPEPVEAPVPSWDRLRQIAGWADEGVFLTDEEAPLLRAIANDYEAMAGRELARQKAGTGPDLAAQLTRARRVADERGRYIEALESVFCSDGVPQAVTRAMEDLRPVPDVVAPPKIADLERVLDELARHEVAAEKWDGSVSDAARRLRAAVALARSQAVG